MIPVDKLEKLLVATGQIDEDEFRSAKSRLKKGDRPLEQMLIERGLIAADKIGKIIADELSLPFVDLSKVAVSKEILKDIPEIIARAQETVLFDENEDGRVKLATARPDNYEFFKIIEKKIGRPLEIYYTTYLGIETALRYYKKSLWGEVNKITKSINDRQTNQEEGVVSLVNLLMNYAHSHFASDVHLTPLVDHAAVRFRIDGILHKVAEYPKALHPRVVARIKILSGLRTDETSSPQDGRFSHAVGQRRFDLRVSVIPVTEGENVVIRILMESARRLNLEDLGLAEEDYEKLLRAAGRPYGMILAVGPTGSGKTTTLYSILQLLNKQDVNIMTIEDPIEYNVERVQQTQVNLGKKLSFSTGLRSIVRQDPDIIMVGEIRDEETASMAVNAAMTGHLVLSTLHANDAATTLPRLLEMSIEPFLAASSIGVIVAQRLVRNICEICKEEYNLGADEIKLLKNETEMEKMILEISGASTLKKVKLYRGVGCKACGQKGYLGRTAIFEVMEIQEELKMLINRKISAKQIHDKATSLGMTPIAYDGVRKALSGVTTLNEVLRVVRI
jgi:type IV pilus assembly protein PilB